MRAAEADLCTARMEAVLDTLKFIRTHEATIRQALGRDPGPGGAE